MTALFQSEHMFSMEELVDIVKLIIEIESVVAHNEKEEDEKEKDIKNARNKNIQRWITRRTKREILFLLASISGVNMKIYSLPSPSKINNNKANKYNVYKERVCKISMDGKYLTFGQDFIDLNKRLEISLGIDIFDENVRIILKKLGLSDFYNLSPSILDDKGLNDINDKLLKPKHCITIHDPLTARTVILQLKSYKDRKIWIKGLCELKNSNHKSRNFRWSVVSYLMSKYASTLNAHSRSNLNSNNFNNKSGLKGMMKGWTLNTTETSCYFVGWQQFGKTIIGSKQKQKKSNTTKKDMKQRRKYRIEHHQTNYGQFGENELNYDPNKVQSKPEENDIYYE